MKEPTDLEVETNTWIECNGVLRPGQSKLEYNQQISELSQKVGEQHYQYTRLQGQFDILTQTAKTHQAVGLYLASLVLKYGDHNKNCYIKQHASFKSGVIEEDKACTCGWLTVKKQIEKAKKSGEEKQLDEEAIKLLFRLLDIKNNSL